MYLTETGYARLQGKLARIKRSLPELIEATAEAAAAGDRSDNAAYTSSKAALRRANWQILEIEDDLKRVRVITAGPDANGAVKLGSVVILETDAGRQTFEIVGPRETNPSVGRVSQESPLGIALIGKTSGDTVTTKTASGTKKYRIIKIS